MRQQYVARSVTEVFDFSLRPREFVRRLGWSSLTVALSRGKGVLVLPLVLLILGSGGYGTVTVVLSAASALAPLALLNIPDGVTRLIVGSDPLRAEARLAKVRLGALISAAGLVLLAAVIAVGFGSYVATWVCINAAAAVIFKAGTVHMQYFQLAQSLTRYTLAAEYISAALALPVALWLGVSGYLATNALILAVVAVPAWRTMSAHSSVTDDPDFWGPAVRLSLPLLPASFAQWALFSLDALLVYDILGKQATGAYSTAYSVAAVGLIMPIALTSTWPQTAQRLRDKGGKHLHNMLSMLLGIVGVSGVGLVALALLSRPLLRTVLHGAVFANVPSCLVWIIVGFALLGFARLFEGILYAAGFPFAILGAYVVAAALNLGLNLVWIPEYGIRGAAYATAAGYAVLTISLLLLTRLLPRQSTEEVSCA